MTDYRLALASRGSSGLGTVLIDNVQQLGFPMDEQAAIRWTKNLNAAGSLDFSLPIDAAGVTPVNFAVGRELHLYRDDGSGETLVWAGHLWTIQVDAPWVRFLGMGWYETFRHRQVRDDFYRKNNEQLDTAWDLIAYTQSFQNGNIGVARASGSPSGVQRTVLHCAEECTGIDEAIEDLAGGDDGFDFTMTPGKIWKTYYPSRGSDLSGTVVLDGSSNITALSYTIDGTQIENDVAGVGPVDDCEPIHFKSQINANSQAVYGLMQSSITRSDQGKDEASIDSLAREQLILHKSPMYQPDVTLNSELDSPNPLDGDFDLGDIVGLRASWGFASFQTAVRVLGYTVNVDRVGRETIELVLDAGAPQVVVSPGTPVTIQQSIGVQANIGPSISAVRPSATRTQSIAVVVTMGVATTRRKVKLQAVAATSAITAAVNAAQKTPIAQAIAATTTVIASIANIFPIHLRTIGAGATIGVTISARTKKAKAIAISNTNTITVTATKIPGGSGRGFSDGFSEGFG